MISLESIVIYEYLALLILILIALVFVAYFEIKLRKNQKTKSKIRRFIVDTMSYRVLGQKKWLPKNFHSFPNAVYVFFEFNLQLSGVFWNFFKGWALHSLFSKQIEKRLSSKKWLDNLSALKALQISFEKKYLPHVTRHLNHNRPLVRFFCIPIIIQSKNYQAINALINTMANENANNQYFYMDFLLNSDNEIHQVVKKIYSENKNQKIHLICLKVLSVKTGFLKIKEITEDLKEEDAEIRWWAVRALENLPSDQSSSLLKKAADDPDWRVRSVVRYVIHELNYSACFNLLEKGIYDENFWVRIISAKALRNFSEIGGKIFESHKIDPQIKDILQAVFSAPPSSMKREIRYLSDAFHKSE